ncbi:hypothetical protein EDC04DRAFT_2602809 [Pisolithus marmoratus]|nr:hypothetical protein EDC04DRAFT_2602809 [Pisolithus marmoratus]
MPEVNRWSLAGKQVLDFTTANNPPLHEPQKFVFAHGKLTWILILALVTRICISTTDRVEWRRFYRYTLYPHHSLGQPFNVLLLVQQPNEEYKKIAAENETVALGLEPDITSKSIHAKVL